MGPLTSPNLVTARTLTLVGKLKGPDGDCSGDDLEM